MPRLVAETFALPKMRKHAHRVLLVDEAGFLDGWPLQEGKVTGFVLGSAREIAEIRFRDPRSGNGRLKAGQAPGHAAGSGIGAPSA